MSYLFHNNIMFRIFCFFTAVLVSFHNFMLLDASADEKKEDRRIQVTADSLNINNEKNYAEFSGNVEAVSNQFLIKSDKLRIYYNESAGKDGEAHKGEESIDKIIADGNVSIKTEDKVATSEHAQYISKTQVLILAGENSRVTSEKNSITGSKIIFNMAKGHVKVEGNANKRVTAVFYSRKKTAESKIQAKNRVGSQTLASNIEKTKETEKTSEDIEDLEKKTASEKTHESDKSSISEVALTESAPKELEPQKMHRQDVKADFPDTKELVPVSLSKKVPVGDLKQIVGIARFDNNTPFVIEGIGDTFCKNLYKILNKKSSGYIFIKPQTDSSPLFLQKLPRDESGQIKNLILSDASRKSGLNAIIASTLTGVYNEEEDHGFWFLKHTQNIIRMRILVEIYDSQTGAKIFDESFTHKFDIEKTGAENIRSNKTIDLALLKKGLDSVIDKIGKKVSNALNNQPWTGFVADVNEDHIIISSGKNVGLMPGNVLDVYGMKIIKGFQNRKFYMPGHKTGQIQLTSVGPDNSKAVLVSGTVAKKDYFVRPKGL